ncbi:adenylyltransferase/cytidyltransferase family protein [Candidatus Dojkabacteria bacterium]|jgi:glycerol-3-phosphate cytidylyltransferase|nr:adenylyltransferase/cytidyltransferase family protein [Candidatus Dojkabacteria bacterium]
MAKQVKGITAGAMDLLHAGHLIMLKEIRKQCDHLTVALQTDPSIDRPEKHKPIETVEERMIRLQACKYVDKIVTYDTEQDLYNLLKELKPDIRFLGADWKGKHFTGDDLPIKVIFNSRNHNYSSSNLISRIRNSK